MVRHVPEENCPDSFVKIYQQYPISQTLTTVYIKEKPTRAGNAIKAVRN
jgi:hypothetical protein